LAITPSAPHTADPLEPQAQHVLMDNRHGLAVNGQITPASGYAEREAVFTMMAGGVAGTRRVTLGTDTGDDTAELVERLRHLAVTPHVAQNTANRASAIDGCTTRHEGYATSQPETKGITEPSEDDQSLLTK
jgi:hypothetical protein